MLDIHRLLAGYRPAHGPHLGRLGENPQILVGQLEGHAVIESDGQDRSRDLRWRPISVRWYLTGWSIIGGYVRFG